jgi:hypothetical protein
MEAELMAMHGLVREVQWMQFIISDLLGVPIECATVFCDNNPVIQTTDGPRVNDRNKHIRPKYFYVVDLVSKGQLKVQKVSSEDQVADALTKALGNPQFSRLRKFLGVE